MKKVGICIAFIATAFSLISCANNAKILRNIKIARDYEYDNAFVLIDTKTLEDNGYSFGDSLDFVFSNGYELRNIPYYDGYYIKKGDFAFVAHQSSLHPVLVKEHEENIIDLAHLTENDTVSISMNKKARYKAQQDSLSINYSNDRLNYESDEVFSNYRNISVGNIKPNRLYRSASPCDNKANRASYVNNLMEKDKIDYVFDLSNTASQMQEYATKPETPEYWKTLFNKNQVYDCKVTANFYSDSYYPKIKTFCDGIIDNDGKYLFHCFEGKDRTGFVAILIESLCGASCEEIENDYFITYKNYYNLTKQDKSRYAIYCDVKFYPMINFISGKNDNNNTKKEDLYSGSINYLIKCGLNNERITKLIDKLTK